MKITYSIYSNENGKVDVIIEKELDHWQDVNDVIQLSQTNSPNLIIYNISGRITVRETKEKEDGSTS